VDNVQVKIWKGKVEGERAPACRPLEVPWGCSACRGRQKALSPIAAAGPQLPLPARPAP
jgi:hypothetical protein